MTHCDVPLIKDKHLPKSWLDPNISVIHPLLSGVNHYIAHVSKLCETRYDSIVSKLDSKSDAPFKFSDLRIFVECLLNKHPIWDLGFQTYYLVNHKVNKTYAKQKFTKKFFCPCGTKMKPWRNKHQLETILENRDLTNDCKGKGLFKNP